jgi:hypothetical protein
MDCRSHKDLGNSPGYLRDVSGAHKCCHSGYAALEVEAAAVEDILRTCTEDYVVLIATRRATIYSVRVDNRYRHLDMK